MVDLHTCRNRSIEMLVYDPMHVIAPPMVGDNSVSAQNVSTAPYKTVTNHNTPI